MHATGIARRTLLRAGAAATLAPGLMAAAATVDESAVQDVIIIGAGLSGLTSARDLLRAGEKRFMVLEASDRVGGRTYNHRLRVGGISEAGGQWIGANQHAIYELIDDMGIGTFPTWTSGRSVYLAGEGRVEEDTKGEFGLSDTMRPVVEKLNAMAKHVPSATPWTAPGAEDLDRLNYYDWVLEQGVDALDVFGLESGALLTGGTHPRKLSLLYYLSMLNYAEGWENLEGFQQGAQKDRIQGGSQWVSERIAESLGTRLRLACPVRRISGWDTGITTVHTDCGAFRARSVVIALSPALCCNIAFEPMLPQQRQELQRRWPVYGPGRKTAHVYDTPFWRERGMSGWIFGIGGQLIWAYDNSPEDGSVGVINAFVHPAMATDPVVASRTLTGLYARALGEEALSPREFHDQDWGAEPWSPSCVSPLPPGLLTSGLMATLRAPLGSLIWSGTETAEQWQGYMDGAVRAGHRAADHALRFVHRI